MKKLVTLISLVLALSFAGVAGASSQDDGGGQSVHLWWEASITYRDDGFPLFIYCLYGSDGYSTWQITCHD